MAKSKKGPSNNYFKLVNPILIILTIVVVGLLVVIYVEPKYITPEHFGPVAKYATLVGTEYRSFLKLGLLSLLALHILESMVVVYKCYKLKLKTVVIIAWTVQTLLLGILSLRLLLWPQKVAPPKPAAKQTPKATPKATPKSTPKSKKQK